MSKKVLIDRIRVDLEPWQYAVNQHNTHVELRICVETMGEEFNVSEILQPDDIESRFDLYFDRIKDRLKLALEKHAIAQETVEVR